MVDPPTSHPGYGTDKFPWWSNCHLAVVCPPQRLCLLLITGSRVRRGQMTRKFNAICPHPQNYHFGDHKSKFWFLALPLTHEFSPNNRSKKANLNKKTLCLFFTRYLVDTVCLECSEADFSTCRTLTCDVSLERSSEGSQYELSYGSPTWLVLVLLGVESWRHILWYVYFWSDGINEVMLLWDMCLYTDSYVHSIRGSNPATVNIFLGTLILWVEHKFDRFWNERLIGRINCEATTGSWNLIFLHWLVFSMGCVNVKKLKVKAPGITEKLIRPFRLLWAFQ